MLLLQMCYDDICTMNKVTLFRFIFVGSVVQCINMYLYLYLCILPPSIISVGKCRLEKDLNHYCILAAAV